MEGGLRFKGIGTKKLVHDNNKSKIETRKYTGKNVSEHVLIRDHTLANFHEGNEKC